MDWIRFLSSSLVLNGVGEEQRVPRNDANASVSMGQVAVRIGAILVFCKYFVFSNFSNKCSAHFAFHSRSSRLACLWIRLLRILRSFVSRILFRCDIKSFDSNDLAGRLMLLGLGPWWIPPFTPQHMGYQPPFPVVVPRQGAGSYALLTRPPLNH